MLFKFALNIRPVQDELRLSWRADEFMQKQQGGRAKKAAIEFSGSLLSVQEVAETSSSN